MGYDAPQLWALEAHQLGVVRGYGVLSDGDDHGVRILSDQYVQSAVETVSSQLSKAGVRLAYVINDALAPELAAVPVPKSGGDRAAGRAYAVGNCSVRHVVAANQPRKAAEATLAPDFLAIAHTRGMSDPALREFLWGPHPTMPTLKLTAKQTDDVIVHILSLKTRP